MLKLRRVEVQTAQGKGLALACEEAEISEQSSYRWRKEYGGPQIDRAKRMKELERENTRLRRLMADLSLENRCSRTSPRETCGPRATPAGGRWCPREVGLSEHRACRIVGQYRGTQRYMSTVAR